MHNHENSLSGCHIYDNCAGLSLSPKMIELVTDYYSDYVSFVKKIASKIFKMRHPKKELEEILSFEIFEDTIIATAIYLEETYDQRTETIVMPTSYLTDKEWESKAKKNEEDLAERRSSYGEGW